MTVTHAFSSDLITKAVEAIVGNRPVYTSLLDFYGQIFVAQEESKGTIQLDPIIISDKILSVKLKEKLPLINLPDFKIEPDAAFTLFNRLCRMAADANPKLAESGRIIIDAMRGEQLDPQSLFTGLLDGDDAVFETTAGKIGADKRMLAFITYSSINPSIALSAEQLSTYLKADIPWKQAYCPVCGSPAAISTLENDGQRFLFCGFCRHQWSAPRLFCPFCSNADRHSLHYFYSDEEKEYRVDVCDGCRKYIKTVDIRKTDRPVYLPLEQVSTLHLDLKARELGLESGARLFLELSP